MQKAAIEVVTQGDHWERFAENNSFLGVELFTQSLELDQEQVTEQRRRLKMISKAPAVMPLEVPDSPSHEEDREAESSSSEASSGIDEPDKVEHREPQLGDYIISIRQGSKIRTLHLLGACHRKPGVDYREWQVVGEIRPHHRGYTQACRQCWPQPEALREDTIESDSSSDDRD